MADKEFLICGKVEIHLNSGLIISFYSDGYSIADLEKEEPNKEFDQPKEIKELIEKKQEVVNKLKKYQVEETIYDRLEKIDIEKIGEGIKNTLSPQEEIKEIKLYEPPLTFVREKKEDGTLVWKVKVAEEKGILFPGKEKDEKEAGIFSHPGIRFQENVSYYVVFEEAKGGFSLEFPGVMGKEYIIPYRGKEGGYILNFGNQLFYSNLLIIDEQKRREVLKIPVLVYPRKLEPDEAEIMIKELLEWHSQLIYDLEPTGLTIKPGEYAKKTPIQRLNFVRHLFQRRNLKKVLNSIMENPHKILVKEDMLKEIQDIETPAYHLLPELITEGRAIRKVSAHPHFIFNKNGYQFVKAYEEVSRITYDTYPNRFVKFFLKLLKMELSSIEEELNSLLIKEEKELYKRYFEWLRDEIEPSLGEMKRECNRILNRDFFKEVSDIHLFSTPSQTLLKDYRYQQVFSAYLDLIKGVKLSDWLDELLKDPIKNMPELYEYWCFLKLWRILENVLKRKGVPKIYFQESGIGVEIRYWSEVEFKENKAILSYNRYYGKGEGFHSYSVPLRPDFSLELKGNLIIFDAKYRVDWFDEIEKIVKEGKLEAIIREERRGTFVLGDLYKMHTYREAILKEDKKRPLWVIALYPGNEGEIYLEEGDEKEIKNVENFLSEIIQQIKEEKIKRGVGAIPLRPKQEENAQ